MNQKGQEFTLPSSVKKGIVSFVVTVPVYLFKTTIIPWGSLCLGKATATRAVLPSCIIRSFLGFNVLSTALGHLRTINTLANDTFRKPMHSHKKSSLSMCVVFHCLPSAYAAGMIYQCCQKFPLFIFDFQLPRDLYRERPEVYGCEMFLLCSKHYKLNSVSPLR